MREHRSALMQYVLVATLFFSPLVGATVLAHPSGHARSHHDDRLFSMSAGGLTIGGPGIATINTNSALTVMELSGGTLRSVCATVYNNGPGIASIRIVRSGNDRVDKLVKNGQSRALCGEGQAVVVACEVQDCDILWRVDRLPQ